MHIWCILSALSSKSPQAQFSPPCRSHSYPNLHHLTCNSYLTLLLPVFNPYLQNCFELKQAIAWQHVKSAQKCNFDLKTAGTPLQTRAFLKTGQFWKTPLLMKTQYFKGKETSNRQTKSSWNFTWGSCWENLAAEKLPWFSSSLAWDLRQELLWLREAISYILQSAWALQLGSFQASPPKNLVFVVPLLSYLSHSPEHGLSHRPLSTLLYCNNVWALGEQ